MIERWNGSGLPMHGRLHEAMTEIERLHALILTLQDRVHNQRVMLRLNWQTIETRAQWTRAWYPSKLLHAILHRNSKQEPHIR